MRSPALVDRVHGSRATYTRYGCRCAPCIEAARAYQRFERERARARRAQGTAVVDRAAQAATRERLRCVIAEWLAG